MHFRSIHIGAGIFLTWLEQLDNIGHNHQLSSENSLVSRFWHIDNFSSEDDINRPGHRSSRDITRIFLQSNLLPIDEGAVLIEELPSTLIVAIVVGAPDWLCVLELLLDVMDVTIALHTEEGAQD